MSLRQLAHYQKLTLDRDSHAIHWWQAYRHPRGKIASEIRVSLHSFPVCLGGRMPREVCWHYRHHRWTMPLYRRTLARLHPAPVVPSRLLSAFTCIHGYEGAWNANTGNGYYGGLQMDLSFQALYGSEFLNRYGTADRWPIWAQLKAAARAYGSGRGFTPWPNTARYCGLL